MKEKEKKQSVEFQDLYDFFSHSGDLPEKFLYISEDSFEFDLLVDYYKERLKKSGEAFESVVYVSEPGDLEKFYSELFNLNMFSRKKICIVKSGSDFLKPLLAEKNKKYYEDLKTGMSKIEAEIILLLHYDSRDIPVKLKNLFPKETVFIKSKSYFPSETKNALMKILHHEKITMEVSAIDEILHKIFPSFGSYVRAIKKLKAYFGKKHFLISDVKEILANSSECSPDQLAEFLFANNKREFFREFSKMTPETPDSDKFFLRLFSKLLEKNNEIRKAKTLLPKFRNKEDEQEFFKLMGMDGYSPARKKFVKARLVREVELFSDKAISFLYETLVEMNFKFKVSSLKDKGNFFFLQKMEKMFLILSESK